jgi:phage N-6-adenine-methyltransferase
MSLFPEMGAAPELQRGAMDVHFSSANDMWATPQDVFDALNAEFRFEVDVCASPTNAKCARFFTASDDGLHQSWAGASCWMNPPYSEVAEWMRKAYSSALNGATVVCLVPSRTDTRWWHDYAMKGEIRFLRGRLRFGNAKSGAPFPSAVVIFRPIPPSIPSEVTA